MGERKSISVDEPVYHRLAAHKRDDESWSDLANRAANALDAVDADASHGEIPDDVLTEAHIDDIVAKTERRVLNGLENRMR